MSKTLNDLTDTQFKETLFGDNKPTIALVDFWAPWCGPCKAIAPLLEELASELDSVAFYKLNIDDNKDTANEYGIQSIPTLILFKNGEMVEKIVGVAHKQTLKEKIEAHL